MVYDLVVVRPTHISPWPRGGPALTSGLLRANGAIHREAGSTLYGRNAFDLHGDDGADSHS
ncbi:hypothetical protein VTK73DRAFT_1507 [Phialemonium thermophilum]|uniref:Uncharacterized protein n=1 Tax=Phialemonium thermophilum TaxID=223376 RepID=A0ABR3VTD5_9PEZI